MGDREIAVPNRTVHNRWMRHLAGLHSERLEHMKSTLPHDPPPSFDFLSQRSKRNQAFMTRASAIERENLILLDKMRCIMSTKQMHAETAEPFLKESLNRERRRKDMVRIMTENEALLRRIQARRPVYEISVFEKAHAQKEYLLSRVGKFPYVSDSAPEATPPPLTNNQLVYFGYKGKANAMAQRRLTAGATGGATLPKIAAVASASATMTPGSQTARPPKPATASAAMSSRSPATSRSTVATAAASSTPASPAPPAGPASGSSVRSNKIRGNKALVYSGQELEIDGVRCQLSVFEKAAVASTKSPAGLEFQAVDPPAHTSTALPIFYSFQALTAAFGTKDGGAPASEEKSVDAGSSIPLSFFSQPDKTRELIMTYLLPKLSWRASGAGDEKRQLYMRGVEEEQSAAAPPRKQQAKGPLMYVRVHLEARGLPADQTATDPVAVMYAQNEQTNAYQQIAHTTLRRSTATGSAASMHKGSVIVPYRARVDAPLRLGVFAVDPETKAVLPTACLGETKFGVQAMLSSEELVVRLIKNSGGGGKTAVATKGKKEATASAEASVRITHSPASSANEEEEGAEEPEQKQESTASESTAAMKKPAASSVLGADSDDDDDLPKKKKAAAKKLFTGGRAISGVEFLVRGVDGADVPVSERPPKLTEPHAILFQLYYRPTSVSLDHAVSKAELPALLKMLASPPADGASLAEQAEALQGLFTATQHEGATPAVSVQFNGKPLVAWKDLVVYKPAAAAAASAAASAAGSKRSSSVKSSPKTSPRSSTTNLASAAAAKTPAKKPATTAAAATPAKKTEAAPAAEAKADAAKPDAETKSDVKAEASPKAAAKKKTLSTKTSSVSSAKEEKSSADDAAASKPAETKPAEPKPVAAQISPKSSTQADKSAAASPKSSTSSAEAAKPAATTVAAAAADPKPAAAASKPAPRPSSAADLDVDLGDFDDLDDEPAEKKPVVAAAAAPSPKAADTKPAAVSESKADSTEADDAAATAAAKKKLEDEAAAAAVKKKSEDEAAQKKADDAAAAAAAAAEKKKQDDAAAAEAAAAAKAKADADAAAAKAKAAEDAKAAEEKKKSEEAAAAKAAAEFAAKEAEAAAEKKAAEAKKKSEEDAAAAAQKKSDEDAATAAAAKAEARKAKKAEEKAAAAAATRAAVEAEAKAALAKGPTPITLSMRVSCTALPAHPKHATLAPMVAMYAESLSGEYGFCSQTERVDPTPSNSPDFATALTFETDANTPAAAVMFSVYHVVEGAALSEEDMVGQALSTQQELTVAMERKQELQLPIQSGGAIVPGAFLTLRALASTPGHASKAAAASSSSAAAGAGGVTTEYDVYVSCRNLERKGHASVSPMVALYAANESGEYGYVLQTERLDDTSNPIFETPIRVSASSAVDQSLMFSIYHVEEGAEISADDAVGAATTTMHALVTATEAKPLTLQIVRDETTLEGADITVFVKKL